MVRLRGPLMSMSAHGTIAKDITYIQRNGKATARNYNKPTNVPSGKQRTKRRIMEFVVAQWKSFSDSTKEYWREQASINKAGITGYQYFIKKCQENLYLYHSIALYFSFNTWQTTGVVNEVGNWSFATKYKTGGGDYPAPKASMQKKFATGAFFNNDGGYFIYAHDERVNPRLGDYYIEAWIKVNNGVAEQKIWDKGAGAGVNGIRFRIKNNHIEVIFGDTGGYVYWESSHVVDDNIWHMVAVSIDRNVGGQIYIDGKPSGILKNISSINGDINPSDNGYIGGVTEIVNGIIDELVVYKRALSVEEILRRYKFGKNTVDK